MRGQRGLLARIIADHERVKHAQLRRVGDRIGVPRRKHREECRRQLLVEPVADGWHRRHGNVGSGRLHMPVLGPAGDRRLRLDLLNDPCALLWVQQRRLATKHRATPTQRRLALLPVDGAIRLVIGEHLAAGSLIAFKVGVVNSGRGGRHIARKALAAVIGRIATEREGGCREELIIRDCSSARTEHLFCFRVLLRLAKQAAQFQPRLAIIARLFQSVASGTNRSIQVGIAQRWQLCARSCSWCAKSPWRAALRCLFGTLGFGGLFSKCRRRQVLLLRSDEQQEQEQSSAHDFNFLCCRESETGERVRVVRSRRVWNETLNEMKSRVPQGRSEEHRMDVLARGPWPRSIGRR